MSGPKNRDSDFSRVAAGYDFMDTVQNNNAFFLEMIPLECGTALDVGCGSGIVALALSNRFESVVGVDVSDEMLAMASAKRSRPNIAYLKMDAAMLPTSWKFDYIVSRNTLHHIADAPALLERLKSMTKPGGRIAILDCVEKTPLPDFLKKPYNIAGAFTAFFNDIGEHGFVSAAKILEFRLSPEWLDHLAADKYMTEHQFRSVFTASLSGCKFHGMKCFIGATWDNEGAYSNHGKCRGEA